MQISQMMSVYTFATFAAADNTNQILVLIGTIIVAGGAYAGIRYSKSGQIRRTEAEKLWDERTELSKEMRIEINALKEEVKVQAEEIVKLRNENWALQNKVYQLERRLAAIEGHA